MKSLLFLFANLLFAGQFYTNHLGYEFEGSKKAVFKSNSGLNQIPYEIFDENGLVVYSGISGSLDNVAQWGSLSGPYYKIDFSDFKKEGLFILVASEAGTSVLSYPFRIEKRILMKETAPLLMSFFKNSRADDWDVWVYEEKMRFYGSKHTGTRDVRGGWYDASGDISKYMSHQNKSNYMIPQQIPMTAWVLAKSFDAFGLKYQEEGLAEAIIDEALWGADYLHRILDAEGFFYSIIFDGWSGNLSSRKITTWYDSTGIQTTEYESAFREGAGVAIAALARMARWSIGGKFSNADYAASAVRAYAHLKQNNLKYCDDGVENILDDYTALLAAVELYRLTQENSYLLDARLRATQIVAKQSVEGYFWADAQKTRVYFHAAEAGLPVIALLEYLESEPDESLKSNVESAVLLALKFQQEISTRDGNPFGYAKQMASVGAEIRENFFIPHDNGTGYWWQGESARQGSISAMFALAGKYFKSKAIEQNGVGVALAQLDWILGNNPYDVSMFSGIGYNNPEVYDGVKDQYHGHWDGGISNGITGSQTSAWGEGIEWNPSFGSRELWRKWRWIEQWLPHSTWFLLAVGSMDEWLTNEQTSPIGLPSLKNNITFKGVKSVFNVDGTKLFETNLEDEWNSLEQNLRPGIYLIQSANGVQKKLVREP